MLPRPVDAVVISMSSDSSKSTMLCRSMSLSSTTRSRLVLGATNALIRSKALSRSPVVAGLTR